MRVLGKLCQELAFLATDAHRRYRLAGKSLAAHSDLAARGSLASMMLGRRHKAGPASR